MTKDDISTSTTLLAWDKYMQKPINESLESIYQHATDTSKNVCAWYWTSIKTKRRTSLSVRVMTYSFVIIGTVLPVLAGLTDTTAIRLQLTQCGVAGLALGGLLQVADRVFGWSSGWLRYITTVTAMEGLTRKFELDWAKYLIHKTGNLEQTDTDQLFDLAKRFEDDIVKLQSDETEKWSIEFNTGTALLGDMIKSQRETGEKFIAAASATLNDEQNKVQESEKAQSPGSINLTIIHKDQLIPASISVDENLEEAGYTGTNWAKTNVSPGQHILSLVFSGTTLQSFRKVVEIPPGGIVHVEVKLA